MSARSEKMRDALRAALAKERRIHAWQIRSVRQSERQTYLVRAQLESERTVENETHGVAVFVRHDDVLGRADLTFGAGEEGGIDRRLDQAVFMAGLGGDAPWSLPGVHPVPGVEAFDPALAPEFAADTSREIVERWRLALRGLEARPSSMELFCRCDDVTFENSAGLAARWRESRASMLTIMLASAGGREAERQSWEVRRQAGDLDMDGIVAGAADEAMDLTRAVPPPSGSYTVVIDADELSALLGPIQTNASAEGLYRKVSRLEQGKTVALEGGGGEPLTLISNAVAPYGVGSYALDPDGVAGRRVEIVRDGVFVRPWATKQFADYLEIEPTGAFGNLELATGGTSLDDMLAGERVLHVRAFSWLNPDQGRGDFSSEIRIGYLYENGARTPVKGGSVSGNVFKAMGAAAYANRRVSRRNYLGPIAARFEGFSVAGA